MAETIELVGVVVEVSHPPPGSARLTIDGVVESTNHAGWFVVEVGGQRIRVDARGVDFVGRHTRKVRHVSQEASGQIWIPTDLARNFELLTLELVEVALGDHVALVGHVVDRAPKEVGFRERPAGQVRRVRALLVARGRTAQLAEYELSKAQWIEIGLSAARG